LTVLPGATANGSPPSAGWLCANPRVDASEGAHTPTAVSLDKKTTLRER
jgi:hypothetical protein